MDTAKQLLVIFAIGIPTILIIFLCWCYFGEDTNPHDTREVDSDDTDEENNNNDIQMTSNNQDNGLDQLTIDSYPTMHFEETKPIENSDANCAICLEKYAPNDVVRQLPCTHPFHVVCIDPWLRTKAQCPLCNGNLL